MIRPMLATRANLKTLAYPLYASPKINGMRIIIKDSVAYSRSMKPIPNRFIQSILGCQGYEGLDGEITVGCPTDDKTLRRTVSGCMSVEGEPGFIYHIFDVWNHPTLPYRRRLTLIPYTYPDYNCSTLEWDIVGSLDELESYEESCLAKGYEGIVLRSPTSLYKYGRPTVLEAYLLKVKRFEDGEAVVVGAEELMHNANPVFINELGYTAHSHSKEGKHGTDMLGALVVRDLKTYVEFKIGTGFTEEDRRLLWFSFRNNGIGNWLPNDDMKKKTVKYKHFPKGVKDKPLNPVFLGFRPIDDMS